MNKITSFEQIGGQPDEMSPAKEKIKALAALDPLDYALKRKDTAKEIGLTVSALDRLVKNEQQNDANSNSNTEDFDGWAVTAWPEPVNGAELFDQIYDALRRFVIADKESLEIAVMWAVLTWLADDATVLPMAMITAPEKGCGKTVLLSVIERMSCRPMQASNISPAALFRSVEQWAPTLFLDEADSFLKENEELRGILNSGHTRSNAYVIRVEEIQGERRPVRFKTWGPKAIAGIRLEELSPTLTSRSIMLPMRKKKPSEQTENLRHADLKQFEIIKGMLFRWASDNGEAFSRLKPTLPELQNRDGDNWEPLLAIAQLAGGEWFNRIKHAAFKIVGKSEESLTIEEELLRDIKAVFDNKKTDRISTTKLLEALSEDDLAPWGTWNRGQQMTPRQLAKRLKPYHMNPKAIKIAGVAHKGYLLSDFSDAFERYLPYSTEGVLSVTQLQTANNAESGGLLSVTEPFRVTDKIGLTPASDGKSNQVTDKTGRGGEDTNITEEFI